MHPSAGERKKQRRRENRRKARRLKRQMEQSLALSTHADSQSRSLQAEKTEAIQKATDTISDKSEDASTSTEHEIKQDTEEQLEIQKERKQPSDLEHISPSKQRKMIKSPKKGKEKAEHQNQDVKVLEEKSSHSDSLQHTKLKTTIEKRPLADIDSKTDQLSLAKKLKTKNAVKKDELDIVEGGGRFDFRSPQKLFESIVSPVPYEQFFKDYWEKKPLIAKRNGVAVTEAFKTLFSRDVLKKLLKKRQIEYVRDVNVCRYVNGKRESLNGTGRATCKQIDKLFDQYKGTLQFHQPQRFQNKLWQLCGMLECLFGCLVGANVYMTPPGSQGLAPHYDDVEVLILQLEGRKHWRLYTPPVDLPRDYSRDLDQDSIGQPTHDFVLEAGDLLYFPRGTVHQADTPAGSQHSTHVTISTYQRNSYGDLLTSALPLLVETMIDRDVEFRRGLPIGALCTVGVPLEQDSTDMRSHLKKLLHNLADHVDSGSAPLLAPDVLQDFMSNRLPPYHKDLSEPLASPKGLPPSLDSFVKMRFPGYMALCLQTAETQDEVDDEEDEDEEDEDESEEDEEEDDRNDIPAVDDDVEEEKLEEIEKGKSTKSPTSDHEWVYLYHCLHNRREEHMMGASRALVRPRGLKFPAKFLPVLQRLLRMSKGDSVQVKALGLEVADNMQVATYLWAEGLIEICQG